MERMRGRRGRGWGKEKVSGSKKRRRRGEDGRQGREVGR